MAFLGRKDLATVVYVLATSILDCCNAFCVGLCVQKFLLVQNAAARIFAGVSCRDHVTTLKPSTLALILFWAQFKVLMLTFKNLYGLGPTYLKITYSLMNLNC